MSNRWASNSVHPLYLTSPNHSHLSFTQDIKVQDKSFSAICLNLTIFGCHKVTMAPRGIMQVLCCLTMVASAAPLMLIR